MKQSDETFESNGVSESNVHLLDMCKCKRAVRRPKQWNCAICNREANKKYWKSLRYHSTGLQDIAMKRRGDI